MFIFSIFSNFLEIYSVYRASDVVCEEKRSEGDRAERKYTSKKERERR